MNPVKRHGPTLLSVKTEESRGTSGPGPVRIVVISAGVSDPSSTRLLTDRATRAVIKQLKEGGRRADLSVVEIAPLATDIAKSIVAGFSNDTIRATTDKLAVADAVIVGTPIYKASMSGLLKSYIDLLDNDLLVATPMILAATAGTARHAMVVDEQMRPMFAFMRAMPVPTSLFAAPEDWSAPEFSSRIDRAAVELVRLVRADTRAAIRGQAWQDYQHEFGSSAMRSERSAQDVDEGTDLMQLARGGAVKPDRQ